MAKTKQTLPLEVQLQSMRPPQVLPKHPCCPLLLCPGLASEIVVKLANRTSQPQVLELQLEADFPPEWCQIGMEGPVLPPHSEMSAVLFFRIADDYFENQAHPPTQINYNAQLLVYAEQNAAKSLVEVAPIGIVVRSPSKYLDFLPEIYQEVDFVGRLLKIFEESLEPVVQQHDNLWSYLDPRTAPQNLVPFLAHWVGWQMTPALSIDRQRWLIKQAVQLYRWRGTKRGLRFYLHLFTGLPNDDRHIQILESTGSGFVMNSARLGTDTMVGGGLPYHFQVYLRPDRAMELPTNLIRQIIEQEKPAFCTYDLIVEVDLTTETGAITPPEEAEHG